MSVAVALAGGALLGLLAGMALLRRSAGVRAEGLLRTWQAEEVGELRRAAAEASRLAGKTTVSAGMAGEGALPFLAADAHFVGHPVHLVVFDGDSEVKAGIVDDLRAIVLVQAPGLGAAGARGNERVRSDAALVAECLAGGRVRWETVRHPAAPG
jgi:predicted Holliday junction resolvase-like endonuclease